MTLYIDTPSDRLIMTPLVRIAGWFASAERADLSSFTLSTGTATLPHSLMDRPDVAAAHPRSSVLGFSCFLDLGMHAAAASGNRFSLAALLNGKRVAGADFTLTPEVLAGAAKGAAALEEKREWCLQHLRCPVCRKSSSLDHGPEAITCRACRTSFDQQTRALNLLTPELAQACDVRPTVNVSAHHYDPIALDIIETVRPTGGKVLDCGAGLRGAHDPCVVNLEIVDYPTTDVIAVGESLPFDDAVFDGALSLNVLEHVSDPFTCAREVARVLKPGGRLYSVVPFLQPEHGYPNHFYNMTRQGLQNLFKNTMEMERSFVPLSGVPIWCLHAFLENYLHHLKEPARQRFKRMTVGDFLAKSPVDHLKEDWVKGLDQEGNWILACTTAVVMRKPQAR